MTPEDPPKPQGSVEIAWSTDAVGSTEGRLTWVVMEAKIPSECGMCGTPIRVSGRDAGGKAIELECARRHKWRSILAILQERVSELEAERRG